MNSWSDSRTGGSDPQRNPPRLIVPPSAPPLSGAQVFPRRRENVAQPPSLTTSLSGVQFQGAGFPASPSYAPTPSSMNSFSSPFSPMRSSFTPSSGEMSAITTPMSSRHVSYNAAYNPQEWGPITANSSPAAGVSAFAPQNDATSIPPPPYSPRHPKPEETRADVSPRLTVGAGVSPLATAAQYNSPAPARIQEPASGYRYPGSRPRPVSMIHSSDVMLSDNLQPSVPNAGAHPSHYIGQSGQGNPPFNTGGGISSLGSSSSGLPHDNGSGNEAIRPPASIRAASTGDIGQNRNGNAAQAWLNRQRGRWEPGMPLPPPPPGPPPNGTWNQSRESSRGHSQDGSNRSSRHRSPPVLGTGLGEVPPTPAGWVDENVVAGGRSESSRERVSSMSQNTNDYVPVDELARLTQYNRGPQSAIHHRNEAPGTRAVSSKGIRERRIEARKEHASTIENAGPRNTSHDLSDSTWPRDLVLGNPGGRGLMRRRTVTKNAPRTPRTAQSDGQLTASTVKSPFPLLTSAGSAQSTPRQQPTPSLETLLTQPSNYAQTPPFSPGGDVQSPTLHASVTTPNMPPRALPTPPLQAIQERSSSTVTSSSAEQGHTPLGQSRPSSRLSRSSRLMEYANDEFMRDAIQRHRDFIEKEASASTAVEALELFANFIVSESKIRQERHASTCEAGLFDVQRVRDRLFQPDSSPRNGVHTKDSPSAGISTRVAPPVRFSPVLPQTRVESGWWSNYKPSLSPIGSISVREDEISSRGRAPSRWWESQTGSESGGSGKKIRRSKQESKYMGVPREVREAMQQEHFSTGLIDGNQSHAHPPAFGFAATYAPNEYPPEKVGLERHPSVPRAPAIASHIDRQLPALDISRFITLPPPYPRHYPAVNNKHPDLLYYRSTVRSVSDLTEVQETKQAHQIKLQKLQHEHQIKMKESRRAFRSDMNTRIEQGTLSYAEAAEAEAVHLVKEQKCEKELVKAEFDSYEEVVFQPLQRILTDRIDITTTCIDSLRSKLFDSTQNGTPNQTQEEGDERPELLEKLTQLKWLFEALEQLHREVYNLESERNERYRAIVTLPYKQTKNEEKLQETDSFFSQDAQNRKLTFATETLRRFESFMEVIEQNVGRGVETQLSAFWDIAPSLVTVLQKIPEDLRSFSIQIPSKEYAENPSYYQFPLQYLYSLLSHAEKSTYQIIESQTNLLCLLHEVKTSLMTANCNVMEVQRIISGEPLESVQREMTESSEEEEKRLTADLKDKVTMVEEQWAEALGKEMSHVKTRVQQDLVNQGGWDDTMFEQS
ncbi:hypothetical protein BDBG_08843 [Blastomyces gilchristii SLH14081]|uniref:Uncharacterized protein n=1 Tax=Blastomyces gilchristii (strain SLH14081) TaxID=559298 RepID=A0A179V2N1_BLAGS|nr:uncharacterized protein BDBG_08843 [Blastomyces gilchristii SLH14081]OAT13688.1 hypothetical protein BDBG_08843 [Blastomyces gilchristii SLH14081]